MKHSRKQWKRRSKRLLNLKKRSMKPGRVRVRVRVRVKVRVRVRVRLMGPGDASRTALELCWGLTKEGWGCFSLVLSGVTIVKCARSACLSTCCLFSVTLNEHWT